MRGLLIAFGLTIAGFIVFVNELGKYAEEVNPYRPEEDEWIREK